MSARLPPGWKPEDVVTIEEFTCFGLTGAYRGTVDAAGRPHGRGDWDVPEGEFGAGWALSCDWVVGEATGEGWARYGDGGVYAGALRRGGPHGRGVLHLAGAAGARFEGEFEDGRPVREGVLLLAGGAPREVWRVRIEGCVPFPFAGNAWDGTAPWVRREELLARVTEGGPPAPRREDGGRLPGPEWAATAERPAGGPAARVRCRSLAEVRAPRAAGTAAARREGRVTVFDDVADLNSGG